MGKKKQRKGAPDLDNDFPEPAETDESVDVDSSEIQASAPRKQDKKKKAKKGKAKDSGWGSDDEAAAVPEAEADEAVAATAAPAPKQTARKQVASAFDLLQGSEDEAERSSSEAADNSDAELNGAPSELDSGADSDKESGGQQGGFVVAEVISVKAHPKADRLRVCSVDYGHDVAQVVTNAANIAEGMKVVFAGEGSTLSGSGITISKTAVRGVDSFGMLCSAHDIGWSTEADEVLVIMPDDAQPGDPCPADPPEAPVQAKKPKGTKKGKAGKAGNFIAGLDDPELQAEADLEQPSAVAPRRKGKKQHKGSKAAVGFAALDDADLAPAEPSDSDEDEAAAAAQPKATKGKKQKAASPASALAALGVDSDDEAADEPEAPAQVPKTKSSKGKKKSVDATSAFAALELHEDEDQINGDVSVDAEDDLHTAAKSRSKKGKKKQTDAASAFAALGLDDDGEQQEAQQPATTQLAVDDAAQAEDDFSAGSVRKAKKSKKAAFDTASAFAALGLEDNGEAGATEQDEDEVFAGKSKGKKKSKKKAADLDSVFAALDQNGTPENGDADPGVAPPDSMTSGAQPDNEADELAAFGKKKKKSSKQKGGQGVTGDAELDALMDEIGGEKPPSAPQEDAEEQPTSKPKRKKKGKVAAADSEDIDALLAQLDGPSDQQAAISSEAAAAAESPAKMEAEPAAETGKGKRKKKKGKAGAKGEEEDLDAVLAELGMAPAAKPEAQPTTDAQPQASDAAPANEAAAAADNAADDNDAAAAEDGKEMTAAEKKKAKKKAREKAKKTGGDVDDAAAAPAAAKKGGKKVSAAVRKMQEEVEARQRTEAEAARLAEEQRIREEEEERQREEEERLKKEGSERRKAERLERRAQLKREGKLLTGKAKKEAERLAAVREQFLKQAGIDAPGAEEEDKPAAKKKVVYGKKKPQPKPKPAEGEAQPSTVAPDAAQPAEAQAAAQTSTAAAQAQAEEAKLQAQQAEEARQKEEAQARSVVEQAVDKTQESSEDDWEDNWEKMDAVPAVGPAAEQAKQKAAQGDAKRPLEGGVDAPAAKKAETADAQAGKQADKADEAESEEGSGSDEDSDSEEESDEDSDEESSSEYSSSEEDSDEEAERRLQAAKDQRQARLQAAMAAGSKEVLRSPICCILGHVDTGKTKILDNVRRTNVQDGEAGGITQQIGATYVPEDALLKRTQALRANGEQSTLKLPGLLIIDTPGHESFSNLRSRGSSLCDIAILVVDMMHGLEQQTIESINLLKMRKTPFVVALNKIDRLFDWKAQTDAPIQQSLSSQKAHVKREFDERLKQSVLNLNEQGLNVALYWENPDKRKYVNVVPTSAITGEGLPDMLQLLVDLTQSMMASRLMVISETQCTVLEVKVIEGLGTTIDVVLVNGVLHESDTIVLCGMAGPIVTQIRSLLTPHPLKELRVRGSYLHHKEIKAAQGVKIAAQNLESAVAGTQMLVAGPGDDIEVLKAEVMEDMKDIFGSVDRSGEGVCVQASTLGSLEALLEFLKTPAVKIPVSGINIGPVHKKDVMRASVMLEKGRKKFACLLAFDVPVTREAREMAESLGVRVFTADIIYHLFDQFTAYLKTVKDEEQEAAKFDAVFPCILRIIPQMVFNKKDPIIVGVDVEEGIAKVGTPICIPSQGGIEIGRIASMELNHKPVDTAKRGDAVAMKIEPANATEATRLFGRHFTEKDLLVSKISRKSIELLKKHFMDDMTRDDWRLVVKLKKTFQID
ncbi:hypothetical protein ABBQ32_000160 [Trebouxia sp. C0010 RCD-2024]